MKDQIQWLGHGSFVIHGPPIIYIDPWRIARTTFHADVILISHEHYEHFSTADIEKLRGPDTTVIGSQSVADQLDNCVVLRPHHSLTVDRVGIKAVPAYSPDNINHPIDAGGLGFIISVNFYDIYFAGDTGIIPEMELIQPDIAILPIDNNGTLGVDEAVEVVKMMHPRWVFPSNWSRLGDNATMVDALRFKEAVGERAEVIIPEQTR